MLHNIKELIGEATAYDKKQQLEVMRSFVIDKTRKVKFLYNITRLPL